MNALKVVALRLQGMKGALEELNEPVDDLMEVSKIQTQILNLTQNQVDIYDQANDKFRSTYDILKDVSEIWDTLSSTERASLTEIMFGKLRANQGLAIIQAFQSGQIEKAYEASINAAGTATKENEEMMKGIQAHINALRGAFEELSNAVIDSNFLKTVIDSGKTIVEILTWITKNLGTLTTIGAGVGLFAGFKNVGLFNLSAIKEATVAFTAYNTQLKIGNQHLATQTALQGTENASLRTYIANLNGAKASLGSYTTYLVKTKIETIALRVATIALNTALTMGISLAIQGIGKLVDKLVITKDELNEISDTAVNDMNELTESIKKLNADKAEVADLVQQYHSLASSTGDISSKKDELIKIQDSLVEKYGDEAKSIDLVNGKYDDQIAKIKALSDAEYDDWKTKNAAKIAKANKMANYNVGWYYRESEDGQLITDDKYDQNFLKGGVQWEDKLAASLYKVKGVSQDIQDIWQDIEGIEFVDGIFSNDLYLTGSLEDAKEQLRQLIQALTDAGADDKVLEPLTKQFTKIDEALEEIATYGTESKKIADNEISNLGAINTVITPNLDKLNALVSAMGDARTEWFKALDEMENGFGKTVDSMSSSLQKLVDGKNLSSSEFWDLMELDTDKIITDIKMVGDEFTIDQQQLIQLKDQQIQKQIDSLQLENSNLEAKRQALAATIEQAKAELSVLSVRKLVNKAYRKEYQDAVNTISKSQKNLQDYGDQIRRNNILIDQWRSKLGDTADYTAKITQQIKELNDYADNLLKAQEYRIDQIIDGHQRELDSLNAEKEVLQDELDALNDQKDAIEDIIKNYESVNSLVQDTVQKEIDSLNEQKKAIEDTYNKRIEALKTENEEREDALEYAQKLANLENAKNNKVRVIDATRGFRYESVKEDVTKAQSDLDSFENAQAIKTLEKARDAETKVIDDVIEEKERYSKSWADILDTIKTEEDELLAAEILGADWREKIAQGDTELMEKFRTEYLKHNTNLKMLTNTEIKLKEAAIKAKDEEINAKNEQIKKWKEYKTEVQNAANEIKDANDGYLSQLSTVELDETSSLERRQANLDAFKTAYTNALSTVVDLQNQLGGGDYYYTMHVENTDELEKAANDAAKLAAASAATYTMADEVRRRQVQNAGEEIAQVGEDIIKRISGLFGYSEGGVADYTGLAMLHGRKSAPETIFNANDSAKLYEMVHNTPNLMADMIDKATKISGFNLANASNNTQNSNEYSFYIDKIVTDNPQDFAKQLDRYYQTKLTESYTNK